MRSPAVTRSGLTAFCLLILFAGQIDRGHAFELEKVHIKSYNLGAFENQIDRELTSMGATYTPDQVSAASREAMTALQAQLAGRTGTAEILICVPPGSRQCIEIVCRECDGD